MRASLRTRVSALAIATFLFVVDQVSKAVAVAMAAGASGFESAVVLRDPGFRAGLLLGLHFNPAAFAGLGSGLPQTVFVAVGLAMSLVGILYVVFAADRARVLFGALLLAGALGNSIDRLRYGAVVDWLGPAWIGPIQVPLVANAADVVLTVACALMLTTLAREAWGRMRRPPKGIRRRQPTLLFPFGHTLFGLLPETGEQSRSVVGTHAPGDGSLTTPDSRPTAWIPERALCLGSAMRL